jgi:hypothetical protein
MGYLQLPLWLAKLRNLWLSHLIQRLLDRRHHRIPAHAIQ